MRLSIIIPFRASFDRPYLMERLKSVVEIYFYSDEIEYILVDFGSDLTLSKQTKEICKKFNIKYFYIDTKEKIFAIGKARDYGVQVANGEFVTFLDIDLVPTPLFPKKLLEYADIYIGNQKKEFFTVPCFYLTQEGSRKFISMDIKNRDKIFFNLYLLGKGKDLIQNFAPSSSVMVIRRSHYLSIGGHRPEFKGHGYEDFELIHRLLVLSGTIPRSKNYYRDSKSWDNTIFEGFRANFSLLGKGALYHGIYVFHLWHPRPPSNGYEINRFINQDNAISMFKRFDRDRINPMPLEDLTIKKREKTIFFGTPFSSASECWRDGAPYLGKLIYVKERDFSDEVEILDIPVDIKFIATKKAITLKPYILPFKKKRVEIFNLEKFKKFIEYNGVTNILFPNPYGNEIRLEIYRWARENRFPFYCFDRGALPDSWFFDRNGFNADSISYSATIWDRDLDSSKRDEIRRYIDSTINSGATLEEQGSKIGGEALRERLKVVGKSVLFVPFQRPSDSVIKYFSGNVKSVENFAKIIDNIAYRLRQYGWVVLCKKHPLEIEAPLLKYAIFVDDDTNFYDLIELSDAVALINSGVGVYSMMMSKPTYIFGEAFYYHPDINVKVTDIDGVVDKILKGYKINQSKVEAFIYHLVNNIYSFGISRAVKREERDGTFRSLTMAIDFYQLILPDKKYIKYEKPTNFTIPLNAPLLKDFHYDIYRRDKKFKELDKQREILNRRGLKNRFKRKIKKLFTSPKDFFCKTQYKILLLGCKLFFSEKRDV